MKKRWTSFLVTLFYEVDNIWLPIHMQDPELKANYKDAAVASLTRLSSDNYWSVSTNQAILLHSTSHKPARSEIDASTIYADHYYLEALLH